MGTVFWIISGLVAVAFFMAGVMKLTKSKAELSGDMGWVDDFSEGQVKAIGAAEAVGAVGVIVPAATGVVPILSPVAAAGLVALMIGAAVTHIKRGEMMPFLVVNGALGGLAGYVAYAGLVG